MDERHLLAPINRNHQILGQFAFLIVCDLVAGLEVAVSIACASIIMHEPVKVTDAIGFAAMTVLTLVLLNTIVQPFLYRFSPYRAMAAIILSIGVIVGTVIGRRCARHCRNSKRPSNSWPRRSGGTKPLH